MLADDDVSVSDQGLKQGMVLQPRRIDGRVGDDDTTAQCCRQDAAAPRGQAFHKPVAEDVDFAARRKNLFVGRNIARHHYPVTEIQRLDTGAEILLDIVHALDEGADKGNPNILPVVHKRPSDCEKFRAVLFGIDRTELADDRPSAGTQRTNGKCRRTGFLMPARQKIGGDRDNGDRFFTDGITALQPFPPDLRS
ncbi:hypothetical protein D3C87_1500110 [compost metagenome]